MDKVALYLVTYKTPKIVCKYSLWIQ